MADILQFSVISIEPGIHNCHFVPLVFPWFPYLGQFDLLFEPVAVGQVLGDALGGLLLSCCPVILAQRTSSPCNTQYTLTVEKINCF